MVDAERSLASTKAYQDFMNGLADISQREPIAPEHVGENATGKSKDELAKLNRQAGWERLIQDRYAADCTYRYKERLKYRVKAFYDAKDRASGPNSNDYRYGVPIRRDTAELLSRPPEVDNAFSAVLSSAFSLLSLIFLLYNNVMSLLALQPSQKIAFSILGFNVSPNGMLWLIFICKECMFFTEPLIMATLALILGGVALLLSPFILGYYAVMVHGHEAELRKLRKLWGESILPLLISKHKLLSTLLKTLSTTRRCLKIGQQIRRKECNASFKDFDMLLLTLSNLVFSVVLLVGADDDRKSIAGGDVSSLPVSLILLLKSFVEQRMCLRAIYQSLKDVNENRLSKFELALLLTKYSEVMLTADVQYNFVQHLYTGPGDPLEPDVRPLENEDRERLLEAIPPLPEALALEFGHDFLGEYASYAGPALPYVPRLRVTSS